jgi:pyruvate carboxylase
VRVAKAGVATSQKHPKIIEGNPDHVGAPMPGNVVTVAVTIGQKVSKGDPLISIEAMKMESMLCAERDAVITKIHVKPGATVEAKDLLVELS